MIPKNLHGVFNPNKKENAFVTFLNECENANDIIVNSMKEYCGNSKSNYNGIVYITNSKNNKSFIINIMPEVVEFFSNMPKGIDTARLILMKHISDSVQNIKLNGGEVSPEKIQEIMINIEKLLNKRPSIFQYIMYHMIVYMIRIRISISKLFGKNKKVRGI